MCYMLRIGPLVCVERTLLSILVSVLATVASAAGINDTGSTACYTDVTVGATGVASDTGGYPRQDCRYGRDAAQTAGKLAKVGAGGKGFDFTKIDSNGNDLAPGATGWMCTRDNVTGLIWEVKTTTGFRSQSHTYKWYKSDASTNGGDTGFASTPADFNVACASAGRCDTEKFRDDVNSQGLCGAFNWRIPTRNELGSLVDYSRTSPSIDIEYFPNTPPTVFWTDTPDSKYTGFAYQIDLGTGRTSSIDKGLAGAVRLVRSATP
jgi:hypothetical protein